MKIKRLNVLFSSTIELILTTGHFRVPFTSVSNRVQVRNLSDENQFSSQVHSVANQTHFCMKGFALELVLKPRQRATRKWPIVAKV